MADPEVGGSAANAMNLLRIKADIKELVKEQDKHKESVDSINAKIESQGPNVTLEGLLKSLIEKQHSAFTRTCLAVSVIGQSIEDLTTFSRNPPSIMAIKDLLDSLNNFTDEDSIETLSGSLVIVQDGTKFTCADVVEDLEEAYKSLSEEHQSRTTEILRATQLAVRDLATNPFKRTLNRRSRLLAIRNENLTSESAGVLSVTQEVHGTTHLEASTQPNRTTQTSQDPAQILDAPSLHRYIDSVFPLVPIKRIVEAVQNVVMEFASGHKSPDEHGPGIFQEITSNSKKELKELGVRVQALEDFIKLRYAGGADKEVKEEETSLQKEASLHPHKRPSLGFEDKMDVKRSRS
ncbi:hypothetical protein M436DRAFT_82202 [Aureobasidium namibiae CBS 147.97]|uniref:Uncharacterized protein n=1 Tax=Aureobasidium namibiae CBS 147.97 TaxID=1043004 RepID=A0A074WIH2_9PEZI|nr:uncharacterized protein M436DRAFT_82202 [Aureobasidium namibiae CBS 147.97]KEQ72930.1 hypothetical protein M436DRAFT_82202 [Aureobasidium namibiae CBS 147.97]